MKCKYWIISILLALFLMLGFNLAHAQEAPAPITPEMRQSIHGMLDAWLDFINIQDQRMTVIDGKLAGVLENYQKTQDNMQQVINTANAAGQEAATASSKAETAFNALNTTSQKLDNLLLAVKGLETPLKTAIDKNTEQDTKLTNLQAAIDDIKTKLIALTPAPTFKWKLAYSIVGVSSGYKELNQATVPKGVRVFIGATDQYYTPFTQTAANTIGIKTVVLTVDNLPAITEYNAPYDFASSGGQGVIFSASGLHTAKAMTTYANGAVETVTASFTVQ